MSAPMAAPVLLGLCDEEIKDSTQTTWTMNKIGGLPDVMYPGQYKHPKCQLCGQDLLFVTQLYCPLEGQQFHRTLYMFGCVNKTCCHKNQSWTILRSQISTEQLNALQTDTKMQSECVSMATDDWCDDADDWGTDDAWSLPTNTMVQKDRTSEMEKSQMKLCEGDAAAADLSQGIMGINLQAGGEQTKPKLPNDLLTFQSYYVNVFDESESLGMDVTAHERKLIKEYEKREGVDFRKWDPDSGGGKKKGGGGAESYEKAAVKHGDKFFLKFSKRLSMCPEQCIRYSLNGSPLYITAPNPPSQAMNLPCCDYCGAARIFELQLMPGMLSFLKIPGHQDISIDFGVILIYTCRESCWSSSQQYLPEYAIVQADPDHEVLSKKRKKSSSPGASSATFSEKSPHAASEMLSGKPFEDGEMSLHEPTCTVPFSERSFEERGACAATAMLTDNTCEGDRSSIFNVD